MNRYTLYFDTHQVALVEQGNADFPNLQGTYQLFPSIQETNSLLFSYIEYSKESDILFQENEAKWEEFMITNEWKYITLIETDKWTLVEEGGEKHAILVPVFYAENQIIWRLATH